MLVSPELARKSFRAAPIQVTTSSLTGLWAALMAAPQAVFASRLAAWLLEGAPGRFPLWEAIMLAATTLTRFLLSMLSHATSAWSASLLEKTVTQEVVENVAKHGPMGSATFPAGKLASLLAQTNESIGNYPREYLPSTVTGLGSPIVLALVALSWDKLSGAILLVTAPLLPFFMALIGSMASEKNRRQWKELARIGARYLDAVQGLVTLRLFGKAKAEAKKLELNAQRLNKATMDVLKIAFLSALVLELAAMISIALVAVELGLRLVYGKIAFETAFAVLLVAPEVYMPLRRLGAAFHSATDASAAYERLKKTTAELKEGGKRASPRERTALFRPSAYDLSFENVWYWYPRAKQGRGGPALTGISIKIPDGCSVALVGPTGAGKSTVAKLALGLDLPSRGTVRIGGIPTDQLDPQWRARKIAWVPQEPTVFKGTVRENIALFKPQAGIDEIVAAAKACRLHDTIIKMHRGYETRLGEGGVRLSGGMAKRLALARALLADPRIIVIDEPTTHMDPELETELQEILEKLIRKRTALIIAHRLSTIRHADKVVLMDKGKVVMEGAYEELAPTTKFKDLFSGLTSSGWMRKQA